jgi:hypothetical protein
MIKMVHFSMAGKCHRQNRQFQHVAERLEYVMDKTVTFSTAEMCHGQNHASHLVKMSE